MDYDANGEPIIKTRNMKQTKTFEQYDKENPQIWEAFEKLTIDRIYKGFKNYSSKSIFEAVRWHTATPGGNDEFKINNNYTAGYARKFMKVYPEYEGFFRIRNASKYTKNK